MLALAVAFAILALAFYFVLRRPRDDTASFSATNGITVSTKPTRAQKLRSEAFEFAWAPDASRNVLVLYATEYGFAKEVARRAAALLSATGFLRARIVNIAHFACVDFSRETHLLLVCSTTGDGVPPNEAEDFRDALCDSSVRFRAGLKFGVIALGDSGYPHFCRGGIVVDELLAREVGVVPALKRAEVDQEDWDVITPWIQSFIAVATAGAETKPIVVAASAADDDYLDAALEKYAISVDESAVRYTRNEPYHARVVTKTQLTVASTLSACQRTDKAVIRVEFDIANSGIIYKAGDALGVIPRNNPESVEKILLALAANGDELVSLGGAGDISSAVSRVPVQLMQALTDMLDLKTVRAELLQALVSATSDQSERDFAAKLVDATGHLTGFGKSYTETKEVVDVLSDFVGARLSPAEVARLLRPLTARYYSISSTPVVSPDRIAITVDVLRYVTSNTPREGVASTFLNDRVAVSRDESVGIFVSRNENFRLPADRSVPIIMIGPGTGIAPFIGFLNERLAFNANGLSGRNVLFFGCRHAAQDYLYSKELKEMAARGDLDLVTAFSRDQPEKIYVQDRLRQRSTDIWNLIDERGAHVYICGDGRHMAPDVDRMLLSIVAERSNRSDFEAAAYMKKLADGGRIHRDIWVS
jgi:sulfite reductase (NADPH) flavoprotein alpha-component